VIAAISCLVLATIGVIAWADKGSGNKKGETLRLIEAEEAGQLRLTDEDLRTLSSRKQHKHTFEAKGLQSGPKVEFERPEPIFLEGEDRYPQLRIVSPASLHVVFEPNLADVDMTSLRVVAKKFFFSKDLTDRLRPFIQGTTVQAENVEVPSGTFHVELSVADIEGRETEEEYVMLSEKPND
jgi:hypothetical protein